MAVVAQTGRSHDGPGRLLSGETHQVRHARGRDRRGEDDLAAQRDAGVLRPGIHVVGVAAGPCHGAHVDHVGHDGVGFGRGQVGAHGAGEGGVGGEVAAILDRLLLRRPDVVHHPVLVHEGRVVGARRVERGDLRVVEVVGARIGRIGVAVRPDDLHGQVLRHPDTAAAVVPLDPVGVVARALAGREAHPVEVLTHPVDHVVEPGAAVDAPAAVDVGGVLQSLLPAQLILDDGLDLLQRHRVAGGCPGCDARQGHPGDDHREQRQGKQRAGPFDDDTSPHVNSPLFLGSRPCHRSRHTRVPARTPRSMDSLPRSRRGCASHHTPKRTPEEGGSPYATEHRPGGRSRAARPVLRHKAVLLLLALLLALLLLLVLLLVLLLGHASLLAR